MASTLIAGRNGHRQMTFEDLKGLRANGYIRDSTLDQRDGFGPDIQERNVRRFADSYSLVLGDRWYKEFVSGRSVRRREAFQQFVEDAQLDMFDVLLVDHTSRFGRNQAECIRYKEELQRLGKVVVFVSQGIISGSDRDFLNERINETLDEAYSRNLSRYVAAGMAEKAAQGLANGVAPLGYSSEKLQNGKRERKVADSKSMPVLLELLRCYVTGHYSYLTLADHLNGLGHRNREGRPFTRGSIEQVLENRFYVGKAVWHPGEPEEQVRDGSHEVPAEVKELWLKCQDVKRERARMAAGHPRAPARSYPFSRILACHRCGSPYHGEAVRKRGRMVLRLFHVRQGEGRACGVSPASQTVRALTHQFGDRVLPYLRPGEDWRPRITAALARGRTSALDGGKVQRLKQALENLRKQHLWGHLPDEDYLRERLTLERELKALEGPSQVVHLPNLERAAQLLSDLPALWTHPGVTDQQREALVKETFNRITIEGDTLVSIEPRPSYVPLFATLVTGEGVGYRKVNSARPDTSDTRARLRSRSPRHRGLDREAGQGRLS